MGARQTHGAVGGEASPRPQPFRLTGEIDIATAATAEAELWLYAVATRGNDVTVDCGDLTFIDASGVRALSAVERMLEARGRRLRLVNVAPIGRTVLQLTGLDHLLDAGDG